MAEERPSPRKRPNKLQRLFELAAGQAGHFTAAQAGGLGYTGRSLVYHVAAGHFDRVSRGFYRLVGVPAGPYDDVVAAWLRLAARRAVVSHDTALALYELAPSRSHEIHLTVPRQYRPRTSPQLPGVRLHTTTVALRRDEVTRRFNVEITAPARTIADVADIGVDPSVVIDATVRALATGLLTPEELRKATRHRSARVRRLVEGGLQEAGTRA